MLIFLKRIKNELFTKKFQGGGQTTGQQVKGGKFVASEVPEYQPIPWVQTPNSYGVLPVFAPGQAFSSLIPISKYWNTFAKPAQKFTNDVMTVNDIMTNGNNK